MNHTGGSTFYILPGDGVGFRASGPQSVYFRPVAPGDSATGDGVAGRPPEPEQLSAFGCGVLHAVLKVVVSHHGILVVLL